MIQHCQPSVLKTCPIAVVLVTGLLLAAVAHGRSLAAQVAPGAVPSIAQIERPIAFDVAKRIMVFTPTLAARLKLSAPDWPLGGDWTEARLYALDSTANGPAVLVAQRVDGAVARYPLNNDALARLWRAISDGLMAQGADVEGPRGGSSMMLSEPAGNTFVRNQTTLGLLAYGPATAAILSESNFAAAGGGYLLAAGTSFFVSAQMIRHRSITRAQTILAFHGGTRGSTMGAAVAGIFNADGGVGFGLPILAGAFGGTVAGFQGARGMSDGEAASSGFVADISALTTLGLAGGFGAFKERDRVVVNGQFQPGLGPPARTRVALGLAIGAGLTGYVIGPRYARRSSYNVTAGDIDVAFTSALLGAGMANVFISKTDRGPRRIVAMTGGLLLGALAADRGKVRHADRTSADGTLVQLGAIAGALIGTGVAVIGKAEGRVTAVLVATGGFAGLGLADAIVKPAADAGRKRGVLTKSGQDGASPSRLSLAVVPTATELVLRTLGNRDLRIPITERPTIRNLPVARFAF